MRPMETDYNVLLSTICLLNAVFAGFFFASWMGKDIPRNRAFTFLAFNVFWFGFGCALPLMSLVYNPHDPGQSQEVAEICFWVTIFLFGSGTISLYANRMAELSFHESRKRARD